MHLSGNAFCIATRVFDNYNTNYRIKTKSYNIFKMFINPIIIQRGI